MNVISVTPVISAGAIYAAGDAVGGKMEFSGCPSEGLIHTVLLTDDDKESAEMDLVLFAEDFTDVANNAAFTLSDADAAKVIGVVNLVTYRDLGHHTAAENRALSIPYKLTETAKRGRLFGQLITRGTPTYTAVDDIVVKLSVLGY